MILKGNERGHAAELALHLLNPRDNDHVSVHAIEGFVADDLQGALAESAAISQATQCRNHLFSLSLNPPPDARVSVEDFEAAIARVEAKLGLVGQPHAIVFHEKNGRRHAHCVWSRIEPTRLREINLAHTKHKLMEIAQELYRTHGWDMPAGFTDPARSDPLAFSREEAGQAKRAVRDPKALKAMFGQCWQQSDSRAAFAAALWAEGYCLARGDRRSFVAVDRDGKIWSVSRWCGVSPKDLAARLGDPEALPSPEEARQLFDAVPDRQMPDTAVRIEPAFEARRARLVEGQRQERDALLTEQEHRRVAETQARAARIPRGLRAAWARLNGSYARLVAALERESIEAAVRDGAERQTLIDRHLDQRRALDRQPGADLRRALDAIFAVATHKDPRQRLRLQQQPQPFSSARLARDPALILAHLSQKHATFTEAAIKRALAAMIDDPLTLRGAIDTALAAPELVRLADGNCTTRDYSQAVTTLNAATRAMAEQGGHAIAERHIDAAMHEQNTRLQDRFDSELSDEQRAALRHILGDHSFACVVGLAGSGKSTMPATARAAWARAGMRVHGAALSGKAAEGMQSASGIESRTLASLERSWQNGYAPIAAGDVLVIDEAGMIGTRQLMRMAIKLKEIGAKLVLVGDPDQLQPIEAGTPFRDLVGAQGAARLTEIHRQSAAWQRQASRDLADGDLRAAFDAYDLDGWVHRAAERDKALAALVEDYLADHEMGGAQVSRLAFAHRRRDVFALNQAIRGALRRAGDASPDVIVETDTGPCAIAPGDRIVFTRNDREVGMKNGMLGTVDAVEAGSISVMLDGGDGQPRRVTFDPESHASFDHGYAVTIHKSQGATVDRAWVLASRSMDAPLTYVAMTRHREALRLYVDEGDRPDWAVQNDRESRQDVPVRRWSQGRGPSM